MSKDVDFSMLPQQLDLLLASRSRVTIADLRTFYPRATWTAFRHALEATGDYEYNPQTHVIMKIEVE
jgi:hypothetical protein